MKLPHVFGEKSPSPPPFFGGCRWVGLFLGASVLALSLLVSGCDILNKLGFGSDGGKDDEPAWTGPQIVAEGESGIKAKFGIDADGTAGVAAAFETLHKFIENGGLERFPNAIRPGDWIDLEGGLAVGEYNGRGAFSHDAAAATQEITRRTAAQGTLCRLIVVGVNSFQSKGAYAYQGGEPPPAHVVFQFQNMPVYDRPMNETEYDNTGGYAASEMRKYLAPVDGDSESGRFLAGLEAAGVPENVLWAPVRYVTTKKGGNGGDEKISDILWLPTEREMVGGGSDNYYGEPDETSGNQARLEYYTDDDSRVKVSADYGADYPVVTWGFPYWTASAQLDGLNPYFKPACFSDITYEGTTGYSRSYSIYEGPAAPGTTYDHDKRGIAPAFCVK